MSIRAEEENERGHHGSFRKVGQDLYGNWEYQKQVSLLSQNDHFGKMIIALMYRSLIRSNEIIEMGRKKEFR